MRARREVRYTAGRFPPFSMRSRTLVSISIAGALFAVLLPFMPHANAATVDTTVTSKQYVEGVDPCAEEDAKNRGKCQSDVQKDLARELDAFSQDQRQERDAWKTAHAHLGIGQEYRVALQEFLAEQKVDREAFKARQLSIRKVLNEGRKTVRQQGTEAQGYRREVTGEEAAEAKTACAKVKDDRAKRICLRRELRITNPDAKAWIQR